MFISSRPASTGWQRTVCISTAFAIAATCLIFLLRKPLIPDMGRGRSTCGQCFELELPFVKHMELRDVTPSGDAAWTALFTDNGGVALVKDPKTGSVDKVCVSIFHQLHCLDMIRKEVGRLHREGGQEESSGAESLFHREHYLHCFDYLAQVSGC